MTTSTYDERNQLIAVAGGGEMLWRGTLSEPGEALFNSVAASINGKPARMLAGNTFEAELRLPLGANTVTVQAQDGSGNTASKSYVVNVLGSSGTYTYDANGNLATKTEGANVWAYVWNALDQLTTVSKNGVTQAVYQYDPKGRRVEQVIGANSIAWTYDGINILRRTATGEATVMFVHGARIDEPLAEERGSSITYLHADSLGSIARLTNAVGSVSGAIEYDAWGNIQSGVPSTFGFTGREWDSISELWYYRARYYSSELGRFVNEDPLGLNGGINLHEYVRSQPTGWTDPLGLFAGRSSTTYNPLPSGNETEAMCKFDFGCARMTIKADCDCSLVGPCLWKAKTWANMDVQMYYNTYNENMTPIVWYEESRHVKSYRAFYDRVRKHGIGVEAQNFSTEGQCKYACDWFRTASNWDAWMTLVWNSQYVDSTHHY